MRNPEGSFSPFSFLQACSLCSGSQMFCGLITHCSWKHRMSGLERKDLVINNSYQDLLSIYSEPGAVPGPFPGMTLFNLLVKYHPHCLGKETEA
jgi:hypothetical protein